MIFKGNEKDIPQLNYTEHPYCFKSYIHNFENRIRPADSTRNRSGTQVSNSFNPKSCWFQNRQESVKLVKNQWREPV